MNTQGSGAGSTTRVNESVAVIFISMMERLVNETESLVACSGKLDKLCFPDEIGNKTVAPSVQENEWPEMFRTLRSMYNIIAMNVETVKRTLNSVQV